MPCHSFFCKENATFTTVPTKIDLNKSGRFQAIASNVPFEVSKITLQ